MGYMARSCCGTIALFLLHLLLLPDQSNAYSREDAFIGYTETIIRRPPRLTRPVQGQEFLILSTAFGAVKVRLLIQEAPKTVNYIKSLVEKGLLDGCSIYRIEPPGDTIDTGSPAIRKGYALVQGGLRSRGIQAATALPIETESVNRKGTVSLIAGTREFFFNLEDHLEWNGSFTAWGEIVGERSWQVLETLLSLPTRQERHQTGTVMRLLLKEIPFSVTLQKD